MNYDVFGNIKVALSGLVISLGNLKFGVATGTDTYAVTTAPAATSYNLGDPILVQFVNANTGASTLNVDSLGAVNIYKSVTTPLGAGDIIANQIFLLVYDGAAFQLIGAVGSGGGVSNVTATLPITSTGGLTPDISTSMNTDRLIGRYTAGTGVMEEISLGTGLQLLAGVLSSTVVGLTDGDKGDITVSASGAVWTIDNDVVTFAKMQNINTDRLIGRSTAGSGDPEEISIGSGLLLSGGILSAIPGGGAVTAVTASGLITSSGGTTPDISTSMNTNRLVGRTTAGVGIMEEIQVSTGLLLAGGVLSIDPGVLSVSTSNAREDDYAPVGWPGTNDIVKVIRITPTNTDNIVSIGGLTSGTAGRFITIVNDATDQLLILDHESPTSTATNRFKMQHQMSAFLLPGRDMTFIYNGTRWSQFNFNNFGNFDLVEHCTNGTYNIQAFTTSNDKTLGLFSFIKSAGTTNNDAGVRSSSGSGNTDLGVWDLRTGSTAGSATGSVRGGLQIRQSSGNNSFNLNGQFPFLYVAKVSVTTATALQDVTYKIGLTSDDGAVLTSGYIWKVPTFATTYAGVWEIDVVNTVGGLAVNVVTGVVSTTQQYLGIWNHGNNGDVTFFSSTDGITYASVYRFTRAAGNFAGYPAFRVDSTVGTTNKSFITFFHGISMNQKR